jgi:hypothetical protein
VNLYNCNINLGKTTDNIFVRNCRFTWSLGSLGGTAVPTTLFGDSSSGGGTAVIDSVDLSALTSGNTLVGTIQDPRDFIFKNCKLASGITVTSTPTKTGYAEVYLIQSDNNNKNNRLEKYAYQGTQTTELTVVRTGGASDGSTSFSAKYVTTANSKWAFPFSGMVFSIFNTTTAANVNVTVEGIWNSASLPNNDDIWFDVEYMGSTVTPLGTYVNGSKTNNIASGSAQTASTQSWDGQAVARVNNQSYNVGDIIKLASNSGRIFFCTVAGAASSSEPAGYASAVDGGTVTDGAATFRAATRFKQTITLSSPQPGMIGPITVYPKIAKASSTFYLDPFITLS